MTDVVINSQVQSPLVRELMKGSTTIDSAKQFTHHALENTPPLSTSRCVDYPINARNSFGDSFYGDHITFKIPRKGFWTQSFLKIDILHGGGVGANPDSFHYYAHGIALIKKFVLRTASTIIQTGYSESTWAQVHQLDGESTSMWREMSRGFDSTNNQIKNTRAYQLASPGTFSTWYSPLFLWLNDSIAGAIDTERVEDLFLDVELLTPELLFIPSQQPNPFNLGSATEDISLVQVSLITHFVHYEQDVMDKIWESKVTRGGETSLMGRTETRRRTSNIDLGGVKATATIDISPLDNTGDIYDILLVRQKDPDPNNPGAGPPDGQQFIATAGAPYNVSIFENDYLIRDFGSSAELSVTSLRNVKLKHRPEFPTAMYHEPKSDDTAGAIDNFINTILRLPFNYTANYAVHSGSISSSLLKNLTIKMKFDGVTLFEVVAIVRYHTIFTIDGRDGKIHSRQHT